MYVDATGRSKPATGWRGRARAIAALACLAIVGGCGAAPTPSPAAIESSSPLGSQAATIGPSAPVATAAASPAPSLVLGPSVSGVPLGVGNAASTSTTDIRLTPDTVTVPLAKVQSSLVSIADDGSAYTFSDAAGPLAQLAPGKVMLLQGVDVAKVAAVDTSGGGLVVHTVPATLGDVVESGRIQVTAPPDLADAFGSTLDTGAAPTGDAWPPSAGDAAVTPRAALLAATPTGTFAYQQTAGGFTYKVGFTGKSDGVHVTGDFCYQLVGSSSGSSCGNGLTINATLDGVLSWNDQNATITVANGVVVDDSLSMDGLAGHLTLDYTVLKGQTDAISADPPVLKVPFAFEFPVCPGPIGCDGIPLYTKFEVALLVKLGVSGRNSTMQGGVTLSLGGSAAGSQRAGGAPTGSSPGFSVTGSFTPGMSITPGASAAELALQFKWGLGLGVRGLNLLYFVSLVTAIGQVTGTAVAAQLCQSYYGKFTLSFNAEAQLYGLRYKTAPKDLYQKSATYKQPPC